MQLSASLERLSGSEAEKREYLRESIAVLEQILRYCDDSEIRGAALCNLADAYWRYGDREKALGYAEKLPNLYKTRETAIVMISDDDEKRKYVAKEALERIAWVLSFHMRTLSEIENDRVYKDKMIRILDILFEGNENAFIRGIRDRCKG